MGLHFNEMKRIRKYMQEREKGDRENRWKGSENDFKEIKEKRIGNGSES